MRSRGHGLRPDALARAGLLALIALAPQALAGATGWTAAALSAVAVLVAAAVVATHPAPSWHGPARSLLVVAAALALATAVQRAPLPRALTTLLQPAAVQHADATARLLRDDQPGWVALTLSPARTEEALMVALALLSLVVATATVVAHNGARAVLGAIASSGLLTALVALGHTLARAERVFGVYRPEAAQPSILSPILNENHLAGLLALTATVQVGLALTARRGATRNTWLIASAITIAVGLLSRSRAGMVAVALGPASLAGLYFLGARLDSGRARRGSAVVVTVLAGIALGAYVASDSIVAQYRGGIGEKLDLARRGFGLFLEHPWIGVGRGAFSSAFVQLHGTQFRYEYPENILVQWASEWGVGGLVALATIVRLLLPSALQARTPHRAGAAIGVLVLGAQNFVDFSLELVGIAIPAVVAGTAVVCGAMGEPRAPRAREPAVLERHAARIALPLVSIVVIALAARVPTRRVEALRDVLLRKATSDAVVRSAVVGHPTEPQIALLVAWRSVRDGRPDALAWTNRAMQLAPRWTAPHALTALALVRAGSLDQALLEVREVASRDAAAGADLACRLGPVRASEASIFRAAPGGPARREYLERVGACLPDEVSRRFDARYLAERPGAVSALVRSARRAISGGHPDIALEHADAALAVAPRSLAALDLRVQALSTLGRHQDALTAIDVALQVAVDPARFLELRARTQQRLGQEDGMRETIERLRGRSGGVPARVSAAFGLLGQLEEQSGNLGRALHAYEEARRIGDAHRYLDAVARVAERVGDRRRAFGAYSQMCSRNPESSACDSARRLRGERFPEAPQPAPGEP
jgi:tetratricopeptide (TPR) repeat protein